MPLHLVQFIILKLFEAKAEKSGRRGNKSFSAARNVCYIIATKGLVKKYRGGGPEHLEMWLIKNT